MPNNDTLAAMQFCVELHALVTDVAAATALMEVHKGNGNADGVEGCKQTARCALDAIEARCESLRTFFK